MSALVVVTFMAVVWWAWNRLNRLLYRDAFSPLNLLFYFWTAPFILSMANLSGLQTGLEPNAILVISLCTLTLLATCLLPALPGAQPRHPEAVLHERRQFRVNPVGVLCFYALTLMALYLAEFSGRDLPLILYLLGDADDSNLHTAGKDSKLQVLAFGIQTASVFVFYLWLNAKRRLLRLLYLLLAVFVIAIGFLKTSKSDIFIPVLSYAGLIYYHHLARRLARAQQGHRPRTGIPKLYKVIAALTLLLVVSVTSIRLQGVGQTGGYAGLIEFRYTEQLGPVLSEVVSVLYGYSALGFQNFSNYVNTHPVEFRIGTSLFRPALSAVMMGAVADAMTVPVDAWNVVSDAANTGTFLTPLYIEGGLYFCLLGSLLYGLLVNIVYAAFRSRRTAGWMFAYIALLFPWTWLFFTNAFSVLSIYINLFYVGLLAWLFVSYRRPARPAGARTDASLREASA
jgi:oligosaccharide repeat unit polymerase